MGTADIVTKEYMRGNAVFADAFNYLIYNGKKVIDPAKLKESIQQRLHCRLMMKKKPVKKKMVKIRIESAGNRVEFCEK